MASNSADAPHQDRQFADKVAVITGASQGLGKATATLMAERGAAGLVLVGRDVARGEAVAAAMACPATFLSVDLGEDDAATRVIAAADEAFGRVDTLVNAAALTVRGSVWDADADLWTTMLNINTRAPALLITEAAKLMKREGVAGTVVNIGSVAASGGQDFLYPYSASKVALHAITRNAAFSLMRHRIRINLLQPGWMKTEGEDVIQKRFHDADDNWLASAEAEQPFGRLIDPAELARAICFLASEESGMMTGAIIDFDQSILGAGDAPKPDLNPVWGEDTGDRTDTDTDAGTD
jgi:NAD(P)-dependent dehydrogenase (short-subunit alcohol dehydrogenase family)